MSEHEWVEAYIRKADESLAGAQSEYESGRFNNCANRAYYAAFQTAISALLADGIRRGDGKWPHTFVQSEFVGRLVNRRHRYPRRLRGTLADLQILRHHPDYEAVTITRTDASRALRLCREFIEAVRLGSERQ
jgi:uncharacterized protein (UPF0332 family)